MYIVSPPTSSRNNAKFNNVKFTNNQATANGGAIYNEGNLEVSGSTFDSNSGYSYLYSSFTYDAINNQKHPLSFQLHTHLVDGVVIDFDYVYISMIIPAVFL